MCESKEEWRRREEKEIEEIKTESQAWEFVNRGRRRRKGVSKEMNIKVWYRHFIGILDGVEEK